MNDEAQIKQRASRLEMARRKAGFEQAGDAAKAHGWNENTYRSHENGNRAMRFQIAEKYAKAFKVDPIFIWRGAIEKTNEALSDSVWRDLKQLPTDKQEFILRQLKNMIADMEEIIP